MTAKAHEKERERSNASKLETLALARDIAEGWDAEAPTDQELEIREKCRTNLRLYLETYFPHCFPLAWSNDHIRAIERIQETILHGGMYAWAMARGSGKTSILERAGLWAEFYGYHSFISVIGATEDHADKIGGSVKVELAHNERLRRPFREICYPIRRLDGEPRRCAGQTFKGTRTLIGWGERKLILPTMENSPASGATLSVAGITGSIRGQKITRVDGTVVRPSLVLVDDPQTRESAMSPTQVAERLAIITGDILGLAGPGKKIAAFCAVTVIRNGDLADQLLDRSINPEWQGERSRAVVTWPSNQEMWDRYLEIRDRGRRNGEGETAANEFYRTHREEMDEGGEVSWPARKYPTEISGLQHCINLRQDIKDVAFFAEYQNQPLSDGGNSSPIMHTKEIASRLSSLQRMHVPDEASVLTAFVDVHDQDQVLVWTVCAWSTGFNGWVLDYGVWPAQPGRFINMRRIQTSMKDVAPGAGREGAVLASIAACTDWLATREFPREDGSFAKIDRCLVDSGFLPNTVSAACKTSKHSSLLMPSRGRFVAPQHKPIDEYSKRPGERVGHMWHVPVPAKGRSQRVLVFDSNYWKTFVHARFATVAGDTGTLQLWGKDPQTHLLFAEHMRGERPTRVTANGRTLDVWAPAPPGENHFFDCVVGCAVAASERGCVLRGAVDLQRKRQRISLRAAQAGKRRDVEGGAPEAEKPETLLPPSERPRLSLATLAMQRNRS